MRLLSALKSAGPQGFERHQPEISKEIYRWADAGLIPEVHPYDMVDDTLAGILKVIREKISEPSHT